MAEEAFGGGAAEVEINGSRVWIHSGARVVSGVGCRGADAGCRTRRTAQAFRPAIASHGGGPGAESEFRKSRSCRGSG